MRELDQQIATIAQKGDDQAWADLIQAWSFFILKTAVRVTKHYVDKQDDEWSVAVLAFVESVRRYDMGKGAFVPFAQRLIHHRLVDHFRMQAKTAGEVPLEEWVPSKDMSVMENPLLDEIEALDQVLRLYGMDFAQLAETSPKSEKTKKACRRILVLLKDHPEWVIQIQESGLLPIKMLEKETGVPRKTVERHRKYLIAAMEILTGDYPGLAEYIPLDERDVK
jgi:RNA polymerase sigma factor